MKKLFLTLALLMGVLACSSTGVSDTEASTQTPTDTSITNTQTETPVETTNPISE